MSEITSVRELIDAWGRAAMATDLGLDDAGRIHKWHARERIPLEYQPRVLQGAAVRGIPLTAERLIQINSGREWAA